MGGIKAQRDLRTKGNLIVPLNQFLSHHGAAITVVLVVDDTQRSSPSLHANSKLTEQEEGEVKERLLLLML